MSRETVRSHTAADPLFIDFKICSSVFFSGRLLYDELLETSIQILLLFLHCNTFCCHVYCKEMKQNERWDENCMFTGCVKSVNIPLGA